MEDGQGSGNVLPGAPGPTAELDLQEAYAGIDEEMAAEIQDMSREEVLAAMVALTSKHSIHGEWQQDFSITPRAISHLEWVNANRTKQVPFQWEGLVGKTWRAGFVKVDETTPIMSEEDIRFLYALIFRSMEMEGAISPFQATEPVGTILIKGGHLNASNVFTYGPGIVGIV